MRLGLMMMLALALAVAAGCKKAAPSGTTDTKAIGNTAEAGPAATPTETDKVEADAGADEACVPACVQRNQMKATSIENIRADCERECATPPTP
jgi:hypothetical protein